MLPPKQYVQVPFNQKQAVQFAQSLSDRRIKNNQTTCTNHIATFQKKDEIVQYDKQTRNQLFNIGESVTLWYPYKQNGLSRCLQPNWRGPWKILKFLSTSDCRIRNEKGEEKNVHINRLKRVGIRKPKK